MANDPAPRLVHPDYLGERLTVGARIGGARYILRRLLGRGGATAVWLAWDVKLEQEVALKLLPEAVVRDPQALERLRSQTRRNIQVAHPHIARTYDFIQDHEFAALALEYVDGWSLATLRVDKPQARYKFDEITFWLRQLCVALAYAHDDGGLLHLGLRPANLMLNAREQLKVTDFGIAHALHELPGAVAAHRGPEHLGFLSPQQAQGEKPSVLDDVYSLGATIYDLLTGTPPFYRGDIQAQLGQETPPSMTDRLFEQGIEDSIPLVVEDAVALCLAKDPGKRPPSVAQVLLLLERSEVLLPDTEAAPVAKPEPAPPPSKTSTPGPEAPVAEPPPPAVPELIPVATLAEPVSPEPVAAEPVAAEPAAAEPVSASAVAVPKRSKFSLVLLVAAVVAGLGAWFWAAGHWGRPSLVPVVAGALDPGFNPPTNSDHEVRVAIEQPDRKLVLGGMFTGLGEPPHRGVVRLNADGSVDRSFSGTTDGDVFALAVQPDGKILLGGLFSRVNNHACRRIARLNGDGSLDERFVPGGAVGGGVRAIAVQGDGKIVVAGNLNPAPARHDPRIARLNEGGRRDNTFKPAIGASAIVWAVALQSDGKILAAGDFTSFNQKPCGRLVRLNPDGSVDSGFNFGTGANASIFALAVQGDGRILIGGDFTLVNHAERSRVARLNSDGSIDPMFNPGAGPNTGVRCLAVGSEGRILIGGIFTSVNGQARKRIARLKSDGALDSTFDPGEGAEEVVRWVVPQADGKVLVVGGFTTFAGADRVRIARLEGGSSPAVR
jgi:uncharacterized delta-60 repeat protein